MFRDMDQAPALPNLSWPRIQVHHHRFNFFFCRHRILCTIPPCSRPRNNVRDGSMFDISWRRFRADDFHLHQALASVGPRCMFMEIGPSRRKKHVVCAPMIKTAKAAKCHCLCVRVLPHEQGRVCRQMRVVDPVVKSPSSRSLFLFGRHSGRNLSLPFREARSVGCSLGLFSI